MLKVIKDTLGQASASFNQTKLRKSINQLEGSSTEHSGLFNGVQRRCVKIPRKFVPAEVLTQIDGCKLLAFQLLCTYLYDQI